MRTESSLAKIIRRLLVAGVATAAVSLGSASVALADDVGQPTTYSLDIPSQNLDDALQALALASRHRLIYSSAVVNGRNAPAVKGEFTAAQALSKLLAGTDLVYEITADGLVVIRAKTEKTSTVLSQHRNLRLAQAGDPPPREGAGVPTSDASATRGTNVSIEEIIVTATKRIERTQDIPMSIAVIGSQDIARRGVIGMEDYLRSVPGVSQIDQGPRNNSIVIRGISTAPEGENSPNGSGTTVAAYFDETPITGAGGPGAAGIDVRPVDLERIEVLRGPQGTSYGSSSLSGTLRLIPVKPKLGALSAKVTGAYSDTEGHGSDNSMVQGVLNLPLIADTLALRIVGYRYDESGYYRNVVGIDPTATATAESVGLGDVVSGYVQDDVGRAISTGGRLAALWQPTDRLNLSLNFLTQTIEQDGFPVAEVGRYEQLRIPVAADQRQRGERGEMGDSDIDLANVVLNYDLGWGALTAAGSRVDSGGVSSNTGLGPTPFDAFSTLLKPSEFRSWTGEVRLASQLDGPFQFLAGLFYEDVEDHYLAASNWPGSGATNPWGGNPIFTTDFAREYEQRAAFGEFSYDLTETLTATVGGRYFDYDKREQTLQVFLGQTFADVDLKGSEQDSNYKASLEYKPTETAMFYTAWSQGFRLGRPTPGVPPTCDVNPQDGVIDGTDISVASTRRVNSDLLDNYEIGGKFALLDRRIVVDAALYHIEWDGLPIAVTAPPPCSSGYVANAGAARSEGIEVQASFIVVKGLKVDVGGSYTEAELAEDALGLPGQPREGARLPGSPRINANLAAEYNFDVAGYEAFVRADSLYVGKFYGDLLQSPDTLAGDYIKIDARAGIAINQLGIELFARNLTNEDDFTWRGRGLTPGGTPAFGYRMRPRTIGLQLSYSFE
jgi:outer membrane receptor protein involved in Fe transport